jgi:hypothetical protein
MLTRAWFPLRPHPLQDLLWRTKARFVACACGRGSGKTEIARRRIVRYLSIEQDEGPAIYFYALPTYQQAKRVAWRPLKALIPDYWLAEEPNEGELTIRTNFGNSLYVVGLDRPHRIEGEQYSGGVIDESCDQKPEAFNLSILPALSHRNGWCWRIGVPKRAGVGAPEFHEFWRNGAPPGRGAEYESYTWPSSDILTPEQLQWAREHLDARDFAEQYEASWQHVGGLVFYAFNEVLNVSQLHYKTHLPLVIGSDFNVDPMAWVIGQTNEDRTQLFILDELFIRNTNTRDTLDTLAKRYSGHQAGFEFFGDATGRARKTAASETDYVQIRNDKRFGGARIFYPNANPPRHDRFAACNAMFCNAAGQRRLFIDRRCRNLIRDLSTRGYQEGSSEPDDYGDVGHATDALGYIVHRLFPLLPEITKGRREPFSISA